MELTQLDKELLDGLQVLTDLEISRVQAHLAAGLPMMWGNFKWPESDEPSPDGCLVATAVCSREFHGERNMPLWALVYRFDRWVMARQRSSSSELEAPVTGPQCERLAALLDMEWSRRVMETSNPVEQTHDSAIIPSLEAVLHVA